MSTNTSRMMTLLSRLSGAGAVLAMGLFLPACKEAGDDFNSEVSCQSYCAKKFDCDELNPTSDETNECVNSCRNSIEDECGNDNQAAANDQIDICVDKSCDEFWVCMVFETAPECFGFVSN